MKLNKHILSLVMVAAVTAFMLPMNQAKADILHLDDVIISFSLCVGQDCINGESFGFDTIRLKENNLRIHFQDTSNTSSFPTTDWRITINDSSNGGQSFFAIDDASSGRRVFTLAAGAPTSSLYVDSAGDVGMGTNNPIVNAHIVDGNTPTLRLEQNGSSGFTPQTWDLAGNEANFFIRDVTNGSKLFFRSKPGAPEDSLFIAANGAIGLGTDSPDDNLDIQADGPGILFTNTGSGAGVWNFYVNGNNGNLNIRPAASGNVSPFKMNTTAVTNLLRVGVEATDEVTIGGNLVIDGTCSEGASGSCADYVFEPDYKLRTLDELQTFISNNKHLPNVPSAEEMTKNGVNMANLSGRLLEKIEELTLYTLQQEKTISELQTRLTALETK